MMGNIRKCKKKVFMIKILLPTLSCCTEDGDVINSKCRHLGTAVSGCGLPCDIGRQSRGMGICTTLTRARENIPDVSRRKASKSSATC